MTDTYFKSLLYRHSELQGEIDRELRAANPNWIRVLKLKKLRLALKDRLHRLTRVAARATGSAESKGPRQVRTSSPFHSPSAQGN